ncbi:MAG: small subunit ribosomal protein S20 [Candidatus Tokpelaia sp. JSC161]|nr:MAG: small subunit ribosomal protein S20 [Candidatus Tokpelaia sp. JSC161]
MANTSSARKAVRKMITRTEVNRARRSRVRTFIRRFEDSMMNKQENVQQTFKKVESEIMRAVTKGVLHKKTASRKISRLSKRLKSIRLSLQS